MTNKNFFESYFYNEILFESENFAVMPSLGSLVEGWLLIVPKTHYLSIGQIANDMLYHELDELMKEVGDIVKSNYGNYIIFEHGPSEEKSVVGCGVDYAHIHIVPLSIDLIKKCEEHNLDFIWNKVAGIASTSLLAKENLAYLFLSKFEESFIATGEKFESQLFRKLIAESLGKEGMWDWKKYPFEENIQATLEKLKVYTLNHI